jgi:hypothetical protein
MNRIRPNAVNPTAPAITNKLPGPRAGERFRKLKKKKEAKREGEGAR